MATPFYNYDFSHFWDDTPYALQEYISPSPSAELIRSLEEELGYKLPASYQHLMRMHNGGTPQLNCFPLEQPYAKRSDYTMITGIYGIGREKRYSLGGTFGSQFMIEEWGYPEIGVVICSCPSGGHDLIMLDYRACGPQGEPAIVHVDQEADYRITLLAPNFERFIRGLVHEDEFDTSAEDLLLALERIEKAPFSALLQALLDQEKEIDFGRIIRNICTDLAQEKGYFALHADERSYLMYDLQFYLYVRHHRLKSPDVFRQDYPKLIALSESEFSTGGYAPGFVKEWLNKRLEERLIRKSFWSGWAYTKAFERNLLRRLQPYHSV